MSDERPPDDHDPDDRADGPTDPTPSSDETPADEPAANDARDRHDVDADGGYGEEQAPPDQRDREPETEPESTESTADGRSDRVAFWISALIGLILAVGSIALVSGRAPFFEDMLRIRPTVEGGGIGADWLVGNTMPVLEALIAIVHFADVIMGIFILLMVFIHWAAFRRLGARMQPPGGTRTREATTATDGGEPNEASRSSSDRGADGGTAAARDEPATSDASTDGDSDGTENGGDRA